MCEEKGYEKAREKAVDDFTDSYYNSRSRFGDPVRYLQTYRSGHNEPDSKSGCRATGTRVRIPPSALEALLLRETLKAVPFLLLGDEWENLAFCDREKMVPY